MGYRGKVEEQERARVLRSQNMTLADIATELGVSKSSVSLVGPRRPLHPLQAPAWAATPPPAATAGEARSRSRSSTLKAVDRIGALSDEAFLAAGAALYAGEGAKRDGCVTFANSDPAMIRLHCAWLRRFFDDRRSAPSCRVYLHQGSGSRSRRGASGRRSPRSRDRSFTPPTGRSRIRAFAGTSMSTDAPMSCTPARGHTVRSWDWCGRCYRQTPFRGSSIGGAAAC